MMQLDWNAAKDDLQASLPVTQFKNWFKPLEFIRSDERAVVLGVPSRFHEDWLRSHYKEKLHRVIKKQCGDELQLEFEILSKEITKSSEANIEETEETLTTSSDSLVPELRPQLHIVEPLEEDPTLLPQEFPSLPIFQNPYLEMDFNHVATQCAEMFAKNLNEDLHYSTLILHAGVGMGKTHLLTYIGEKIHERYPNARIRYTSGESFSGEFVESLHNGDRDAIVSFKRKYREHTDILLFDDLQGLAKKIKTQHELLHIFNEFSTRGGKIVFTTTVLPRRLENFIEPLRSRILSGVMGEVKYPSFNERVAIIGKMCEHYCLDVEPSVLRTLADQGQKDIRELIGTLLRTHLQAKLENRPLDHDFLSREGWVQEPRREGVGLDEIIALVEHNFGISRTDLFSKSRKGTINWARQVAMFLARHHTLLSLEEIGKRFGRDHATVIHAFQKVVEKTKKYSTHRYEVEFLTKKLHHRTPPRKPQHQR